ncbi:serine/threonine-protein kinase ATR-like isoform X2 [Tasmannia lanceolata]|uniref:serine/threonine-protein kinase ATR-like isoform X2 n=1 Tax=Tasmannia lanceolata TaxID=3420 RepID=UPI00406489C5
MLFFSWEILLLEGIEMYGLGNWTEVAEHVGTKNKAQCIDHYTTQYMNSPCYPLPDMSHVVGKNRKELLAMAKVHDKSNVAGFTKVSLKCFHGSFALISSALALLSDLPACCRPTDGPGVLIDLTDKPRWQPFATWTIKLLSKCLTEGTLYVEGLINASFVTAACTLLCYGDSALHMACFDFTRITTSVIDADIVPSEKLIRSISSILSQDKKEIMFSQPIFCLGITLKLNSQTSVCQKLWTSVSLM